MKRKATIIGLFMAGIIFCCAGFGLTFLGTGKPLSGLRIVIDPGHGGTATSESPTGGTKGPSGLREADVNLAVGLQLRKLLADAGAKVFMTREVERRMTPIGATYTQELHARVDVAVLKQADVFIALHHNAPGGGRNPEEINYTSTYVSTTPTDAEMELAKAIQRNVVARISREDRGVMRGDFHVLRENPCQAILVEFSFLTNSAEELRLRDTRYNYLQALGVFDGLVSYVKRHNIKKVPPKPLALKQDRNNPGFFIDHYVPRLYNPVRGDIDQRYLYGVPDEFGKPRRFISFNVPAGTPVYPAWEGKVVYVNTTTDPEPKFGYKNSVVIRHDHLLEGTPIFTIYGNMKTVLAWTNQQVTPETNIGITDSPDAPSTVFKFEVRVDGDAPEYAENPELWLLSLRNREAGYVVGRLKKVPDTPFEIKGLVKVLGEDKTPKLTTYARGVKGSTWWNEHFAVGDVMPTSPGSFYRLKIGSSEIEIEVQAGKVTYVNLANEL